MEQEEIKDTPTRKKVGLLWVLLITLVCLIPVRLFVLGTYVIGDKSCTSPAFQSKSLLIVNYLKAPRQNGEKLIFSYTDSLHRKNVAPAEVVKYQPGQADSLLVKSCSAIIKIPRTAVKGKVVSTLNF